MYNFHQYAAGLDLQTAQFSCGSLLKLAAAPVPPTSGELISEDGHRHLLVSI